MTRKLPPLNALRAFEAAARLGSFTAAADELCVTHGAVSRQIQQLEGWFGHALFTRYNRRVELTESGSRYVSSISEAFDLIATATLQQTRQQKILRVNAPATFALRWLLPRLSAFQALHAGIEVRLSTSNDPIEKMAADVDVVIRGGPKTIDDYVAEEFLSEVRLPVCSPRLLNGKTLDQPSDLLHFTLLHAATYPGMWSDWLAATGNPTLVPQHSLTLEHFYMTLQGAVDGLGVAMGPLALVADDIAEGRLVCPFDGPVLPPWRYFTYVRTARANNDAVRAFQDWLALAACFKRSPGSANTK